MLLFLNIVLLGLVCATSIVPIGGDVWTKNEESVWKRIRFRGWVTIALFVSTLCVGVGKEWYAWHDGMVKEGESKMQFEKISLQLADMQKLLASPDIRQTEVVDSNKTQGSSALVIRQSVNHESSDKLNPYTITLQTDVPPDVPDRTKILSRIKRVVYYLDPRWYSRPLVEVSNPVGGFRYSFGSSGSTEVTARIFLEDPEETVIRTGRISTSKTQTFSTN